MRTILIVGRSNYFYWTASIHLRITVLMYLWAACETFTNVKIINQAKYHTLDL